jgi:hypothetical protein
VYYTDVQGRSLPVNYRICDKTWKPRTTTSGHAGRSIGVGTATSIHDGRQLVLTCEKNLKTVNHRMGLMFTQSKPITVSVEGDVG